MHILFLFVLKVEGDEAILAAIDKGYKKDRSVL